MRSLPVPLYHGTSSLFLSSIRKSGLGGANPIIDWKVRELALAIWPLVQDMLSNDEEWILQAQAFEWMVEQKSAAMNFQHGECYVSPSQFTAARYALSNRFGSEFLSHTIELLSELLRRRVAGINELRRQFPEVFRLIHGRYAPILIEINHSQVLDLADEHGREPSQNIALIEDVLRDKDDIGRVIFQQVNFRLRSVVPLSGLSFSLINNEGLHTNQLDICRYALSVPSPEQLAC